MDITAPDWFAVIVVVSAIVGAFRWVRRKVGKDTIFNAVAVRTARGQPLSKEQVELFTGGVREVCKKGHMRFSRKLVARLLLENKDVWTFAEENHVDLLS